MRLNHRMIAFSRLLSMLAVVAFLALACGSGGAEPTADPERPPTAEAEVGEPVEAAPTAEAEVGEPVEAAPTAEAEAADPERPPTAEAEAGEPVEAAPTAAGEATETATPDQQQAVTDADVEPATAPSGTSSCQLVEGEPGQVGEVELQVEVIVDGLEIPWGLAILPSGDLLITERPGRVRLIQSGEVVPESVLEFVVSMPPPLYGLPVAGSEGGLLGLLLHPDFADNRQFYVFYNFDKEEDLQVGRIERYVLSDDGRSATLDRVILDDLPAGLHHQGGRMRLGPDGMLYVGVGAYDPYEAQNPETLAGKLLRMTLEGSIPADNPDPDSYIFASGIRNTQGYDWFDDEHIISVEHGPSGIELGRRDLRGFDELNVLTAGANMGWPVIWGCDTQGGLVTPVLSWKDSVPPTGAMFYRGDLIPEWKDSFLFTTVGLTAGEGGRHLHRVVFDDRDPYTVLDHEVYLRDVYGRLRTIVSDADGWLYVMTSNCDNRGTCPPEGDKILRIGPAR